LSMMSLVGSIGAPPTITCAMAEAAPTASEAARAMEATRWNLICMECSWLNAPPRDARWLLLIRSRGCGGSAGGGVREAKETHVDATAAKARFAIAQVVRPQPAKRIVVAQRRDGRPGR